MVSHCAQRKTKLRAGAGLGAGLRAGAAGGAGDDGGAPPFGWAGGRARGPCWRDGIGAGGDSWAGWCGGAALLRAADRGEVGAWVGASERAEPDTMAPLPLPAGGALPCDGRGAARGTLAVGGWAVAADEPVAGEPLATEPLAGGGGPGGVTRCGLSGGGA